MKAVTRYFLLIYCFIETFVFTGILYGWNALQEMLLQENVYVNLCERNESYVSPNGSQTWEQADPFDFDSGSADTFISNSSFIQDEDKFYLGCDAQKQILNLAYTIGGFFLGSSAFIWGILLERWGLRCVRLILNVLLTASTVFLSLTGEGTPYFIFPSLILFCLVGTPLRIANLQVADLFPKQRATVITLYSGAFVASSAVFALIKYAYVAGFSWEMACFLLIALSVVMLPITLFVLPAWKVEDPSAHKAKLFASVDCTKEIAGVTAFSCGEYKKHNLEGNGMYEIRINGKPHPRRTQDQCSTEIQVPLIRSILSSSFFMHVFWYCWLLMMTIEVVGDLHFWSERSSIDPSEGSFFGDLNGLLQLSALILAPLAGMFVDWRIAEASKAADEEERQLKLLQSNFWPMIVPTIMTAAAQVARFFDNSEAIIIAIVFTSFSRTFTFASGATYLRTRFPPEHFGMLLSILCTVIAIFTLLQFPLYVWETTSVQSPVHVNIFNSVCLLIASIHPLLILVTPLQRSYIRKETAEEETRSDVTT